MAGDNNSSEAGLIFPRIFLRHRYNDTTFQMGLPEELYSAMLEVGHCAHRHKIPGPLAHTMVDTAQKSLELWRDDERIMVRFAHKVLAGPTNLRATTGQLPEPVASACWRLLGLVEYLATLHYGLSPNSKVVKDLL